MRSPVAVASVAMSVVMVLAAPRSVDHVSAAMPATADEATPDWLLVGSEYSQSALLGHFVAASDGTTEALAGYPGSIGDLQRLTGHRESSSFGGQVLFVDAAKQRLFAVRGDGQLHPLGTLRPSTTSVNPVAHAPTVIEILGVETIAVVDAVTGAAVEVPKSLAGSAGYRPGAIYSEPNVVFGRRVGDAESSEVFDLPSGQPTVAVPGVPVAIGPKAIFTSDDGRLVRWAFDGAAAGEIDHPVVADPSAKVADLGDGSIAIVSDSEVMFWANDETAPRTVFRYDEPRRPAITPLAAGAFVVGHPAVDGYAVVVADGEVVGGGPLAAPLGELEGGGSCAWFSDADGVTLVTATGEFHRFPELGTTVSSSDDRCTVATGGRDGTLRMLRNGALLEIPDGWIPRLVSADGRYAVFLPTVTVRSRIWRVDDLATGTSVEIEFDAEVGDMRLWQPPSNSRPQSSASTDRTTP